MTNKYYKWAVDNYKKGIFLLKTSDFPSAYFIDYLEENKLIFSLRQGYYCILVNGRNEIDTVKHYFFDILKIILNDKYGINWYLSDEIALNIQNKNLEKYPKNISIRTKNGKSMIFSLIDLPDFKVNVLNRTDKNVGNIIYDEFRGMRVKYKEKEIGIKTTEVKEKELKNNKRNIKTYKKVLKIIVNEGVCNISDLLYLSDLSEEDLKKDIKKLINKNLIFKKKNNYSIFNDFLKNNDVYEDVSDYINSEKRKKIKNIYISSKDNKYYKKIYSSDFSLLDLNNDFIDKVSKKYKKIKSDVSFLKKEKLNMIFKSAELEGFGGTYADTRKLIEENIKPLGMNEKDKNILLNIKDAFDYIIKTDGNVDIIEVNNLIQRNLTLNSKLGIRRQAIDVKIKNSIYYPIKGKDVSDWGYNKLLKAIDDTKKSDSNYIEKAFKVLMLVSFTQLFFDGNKRTARIMMNAILYKHNLPFVNFTSVEKGNYDKSIVAFYETGDLTMFRKYFIQSFMQGAIRVLFNIT